MDRRRFLLTSLAGACAAPLAARAQQAGKIWRIGLLDHGSDPGASSRWKALRDRLRDLGYVEGQSVLFEYRGSDGHQKALPGLAADLVKAKVDMIVTTGSESSAAVKKATGSIPVVMATGGDPVSLGLVASLSRPGGNVTGVISMTSELAGKRLELLKQLIPRVSRVAILRDPGNRGTMAHVSDAEKAAKSLGVALHIVNMRGHKDLDNAMVAAKQARADAVIFTENTAFLTYRQIVADLAITHRLPMVAPAKEYALAGVLCSYGTNYPDLFRRAAGYVDRILKGANPADLPIEQPTTFELVINLKTAKTLNLTIPPSLLARADQVIE